MNYHNLTYPDQNNGDGLRVVLWLSGCSHHCKGCQNPQTWDENSGILFDDEAKKELFNELKKDYISGITFSGGDPLNISNLDDVLDLINNISVKYPNKTIWIYSGYTWEECQPFKEDGFLKPMEFAPKLQNLLKKRFAIISKCNVFVDGEYIEELKDITLPWRGSSNQRVIDVQKSLKEGKVILHCK